MTEELPEFRVEWQQCPHVKHTKQVLFVKAASEEDAKLLVRDHVERKFGITWFSVYSATLVVKLPPGEVLS